MPNIRLLLLLAALATGLAACDPADNPTPSGYRTDGTAKVQVCKGVGIEKCDYEPTDIPELIDLRSPQWMTVRSERKSSDWTMCYMDLPGGTFEQRKLMFDCEPVYEPLPDPSTSPSDAIREGLMKSMANMAEAAAMFRVCAANDAVDDETSLKWTGHSIAVTTAADRMTTHHDAPELYIAYEMHRAKLVESEEFQRETLVYTNNCDAESLREAGEFVRQSKDIEEYYLSN